VDATDKTADPFKIVQIIQFGGAPAPAREQCNAKTIIMKQRVALAILPGSDNRNILCGQCLGILVLLDDAVVRPALRPVEFSNDGCAVIYADLENPVFVTVEGQQVSIWTQACGFHGIQYQVRRQTLIDVTHEVFFNALSKRLRSKPSIRCVPIRMTGTPRAPRR